MYVCIYKLKAEQYECLIWWEAKITSTEKPDVSQGSAIKEIRQYKITTKVFWSQNGLFSPPSQPLQMHLYISFIYIFVYIYNIESVSC